LAKKIWFGSDEDGVDRCGFLQCMAWTAMSVHWTMEGGILSPRLLGQDARDGMRMGGGFSFVLISGSHIGFNKEANQEVAATLQKATTRINELPTASELLVHNGDRKFTVLIMDTEQRFSFTFKEAGSYPYFCKILSVMTGGVLVVCGVS
jgi:hypothetical protein